MKDQATTTTLRRPVSKGHMALDGGALAMAAGAFAGHWLMPDRLADHYGWPRDRWYQREIAAFNAGLGYVGSWATAAMLLAATRAAAIRSGERSGPWNVATVIEDAALGVGALALLRHKAHRR